MCNQQRFISINGWETRIFENTKAKKDKDHGRNGSDKGEKELMEAEKILVFCRGDSFPGSGYRDVTSKKCINCTDSGRKNFDKYYF